MKKVKIRNWLHALVLTRDLHQKAIDNNKSYLWAKGTYQPPNWITFCPLCQHHRNLKGGIDKCNCPWVKITGTVCTDFHTGFYGDKKFDFDNNEESIKRLNKWIEIYKKKPQYKKEKKRC